MMTKTKLDRKRELERLPREQIIAVWQKAMNVQADETIKPAHLMIRDILDREFPE